MMLRDPAHVIWNLFLAIIPVALAFIIASGLRNQKRAGAPITWLWWTALLIVWLVFLPNTCYLLTEWRHYFQTLATSSVYWQAHTGREAFIDFLAMTGFYIVYTGSGLLTFFLAVWPLDRLARRRLRYWIWPCQGVIFALCSLGVYLGLIDRFNSWDIAHPYKLTKILETSLDVQAHPLLLTFILGFAAILWVLYTLFDIWMDGAAWRLRGRRERRHAPNSLGGEEGWHNAAP